MKTGEHRKRRTVLLGSVPSHNLYHIQKQKSPQQGRKCSPLHFTKHPSNNMIQRSIKSMPPRYIGQTQTESKNYRLISHRMEKQKSLYGPDNYLVLIKGKIPNEDATVKKVYLPNNMKNLNKANIPLGGIFSLFLDPLCPAFLHSSRSGHTCMEDSKHYPIKGIREDIALKSDR